MINKSSGINNHIDLLSKHSNMTHWVLMPYCLFIPLLFRSVWLKERIFLRWFSTMTRRANIRLTVEEVMEDQVCSYRKTQISDAVTKKTKSMTFETL